LLQQYSSVGSLDLYTSLHDPVGSDRKYTYGWWVQMRDRLHTLSFSIMQIGVVSASCTKRSGRYPSCQVVQLNRNTTMTTPICIIEKLEGVETISHLDPPSHTCTSDLTPLDHVTKCTNLTTDGNYYCCNTCLHLLKLSPEMMGPPIAGQIPSVLPTIPDSF